MTTFANKNPIGRARSTAWRDLLVVGAILALLAFMFATGRPGGLGELTQGNLRDSFSFFVSVQFILAVPLIFALEYIIPGRPEERGFTPAVALDALYMMLHLPAIAAVMVFVSEPITDFLAANASWLVIDSTRSWPLPVAAILGVAIADFGGWASHWARHKVPLFWRFHMIHHSQTRMSLFTANRTHPVDALIEGFTLLLPFFIFFPSIIESSGSVFLIAVSTGWHARFQHANIGTNLGPLRWIFVTPQSHRVHHSTEPEHWNSNFSTIFAWDRLFGTQHADVTSYPPTGINDPFFPEPTRWSLKDFASSFVGHLMFPLDAAAVARASTGSPHDNPSPT